jgi:hypothetical protein
MGTDIGLFDPWEDLCVYHMSAVQMLVGPGDSACPMQDFPGRGTVLVRIAFFAGEYFITWRYEIWVNVR